MRNSLRRITVLAMVMLVLCLAWGTFAASDSGRQDADRFTLVRQSASPPQSSQIIGIDVNATAYARAWDRDRIVLERFPLPGNIRVDLELERFEVTTSDARFVVVDASGEREVARPALRSFRGAVIGDAQSVVVLSLFEGRVTGSIRMQDGDFTIGPRGETKELAVWMRSADPDEPNKPPCDADGLDHSAIQVPGKEESPSVSPAIDSETLLTAYIAIDATFEWYDNFGSLEAAETYILNLMAQVSTIYENEVNVGLEVPYLRVFTVPDDPYTDGETNAGTLLGELRAEWNANQTDIDRTVVHLFSKRPSGGSGVAYINVLCHHNLQPGTSYDYGVTTLSANGGSWEPELVAHELGHNFSSPHTHCYVPEIDQCANETGCYEGPVNETVGTIMSYCNSSDPVFHQRVEDEKIRPAAEAAHPTCITADAPQGDPPPPPQNVSVS